MPPSGGLLLLYIRGIIIPESEVPPMRIKALYIAAAILGLVGSIAYAWR